MTGASASRSRRRRLTTSLLVAAVASIGLEGCIEDWSVARWLSPPVSPFSAPPPPPILEVPLFRPQIWVGTSQVTLSGRCHASVEEIVVLHDDGSTTPLPHECPTSGRFAGEIGLDVGDNPATLVARNRHGETHGPSFVLHRDDDPFHRPHVREESQATVEKRCELAVDENDGVFLACADHAGSFVKPFFSYGTAGFIGRIDGPAYRGSNVTGLQFLHAGTGAPILLTSDQDGTTDSIVAVQVTTTGARFFPPTYTYDPQCSCSLAGALDDVGNPVAVFSDRETTDAPTFLVSRRWDGTAWQPVTLPAEALTNARFVVSSVSGSGVLLAMSSGGQIRVLRLDGDHWVFLGAAIGSVDRPLKAEALFAGASGEPWLVAAAEGVARAVFQWDGATWVENATTIPGAGTVFGGVTVAAESFVGVQNEGELLLYRRASSSEAWIPIASPASSSACRVPDGEARMVVGGKEPGLFVGWPCGGDFFVVRLRDGVFEDVVTTSALAEGSTSSISYPPELAIVDSRRMFLVFPQDDRYRLDEWDGARWIAHEATLPVLSQPNPERPRMGLDSSGRLHLAAVGTAGEAVFRWSGSDWQELAALDNGERILDVLVTPTDVYIASAAEYPAPVSLNVWVLGSGRWEQLGGELNSGVDVPVNAARLAVDDVGRLIVASAENNVRRLYVHRFDGVTWEPLEGVPGVARMDEHFIHAGQDGHIYLLKQEGPFQGGAPTMLQWSDANRSWSVVGTSPLNVGTVGGYFFRGDASAVWSNSWMAVAVRETLPASDVLQISLYASFYDGQWLPFSTDLEPSTWGRVYVDPDDELYWLSRSPFGGDVLSRLARPW